MQKKSLAFVLSFVILTPGLASALEISPQNLIAGKTSGIKLLEAGVDVSKNYTLSYEDLDPTVSELSISSFNGSPTAIPIVAGSSYKIVATSKTNPSLTQDLFVNILPGSPSKIVVVSGNNQSGSINSSMIDPLIVKVLDAKGNAIPGVTVNWVASSGSLDPSSSTSSSDGTSQASFTNGGSVGTASVTASLASNSLIKATFSESAKASTGAGVANKLAFNSFPSSYIIKDNIIPFLVDVKDSLNSTINSSAVVSISAYSNSSCSSPVTGILSGTLSRAAEGGTASFSSVASSLSYNSVGTIYLKASSPGLVSVCSRPLSIIEQPTAPSKLAFIYPPLVSSVQNKTFSPNIKVALQDARGNIFTSGAYSVSLSAYSDAACSAPAASQLAGTLSVFSSSGYASFSGISYPDVSDIYLKAESSGLVSCSKLVQVSQDTSQVPASLKITQVSTSSEQNKLFSVQPKVSVLNSSNGLVTSGSIPVALSAYSDAACSVSPSANLSGTLSSNSISGVASFSNIAHSAVGTIYIKASSGSISSPCSAAIAITQPAAGTPNQLAFFLQPSASGSANVLLSQQPKVEIQDALGARVLTANASVSIGYFSDSACSTPISGVAGSSLFSSSGLASFSNIKVANAGTYYLKASSGTLKAVCSSAVIVSASQEQVICSSSQHIENNVCVSNTQDCSSQILNATSASKVWNGSVYGSCQLAACSSGYHVNANSCVNNIQSCSIANGVGSQTWNGSAYGSCQVVSCNSSYHQEAGACLSNTRNCSDNNGSGQQSYVNGAWESSCTILSCNQNFDLISGSCFAACSSAEHRNSSTNACESNILDCSSQIANAASASKTWSGSAYGSCQLASCSSGYHVNGNSCSNNIQSCVVSNGVGSQTWNSNSSNFSSCQASSCDSGYHVESSSCLSNTKSCSESNGSGQQIWNGSAYGSCNILSCNQSYELISGQCYSACASDQHRNSLSLACDNNTIDCTAEFANALAATKIWDSSSSQYGSCLASSCVTGYNLSSDSLSCSLATVQPLVTIDIPAPRARQSRVDSVYPANSAQPLYNAGDLCSINSSGASGCTSSYSSNLGSYVKSSYMMSNNIEPSGLVINSNNFVPFAQTARVYVSGDCAPNGANVSLSVENLQSQNPDPSAPGGFPYMPVSPYYGYSDVTITCSNGKYSGVLNIGSFGQEYLDVGMNDAFKIKADIISSSDQSIISTSSTPYVSVYRRQDSSMYMSGYNPSSYMSWMPSSYLNVDLSSGAKGLNSSNVGLVYQQNTNGYNSPDLILVYGNNLKIDFVTYKNNLSGFTENGCIDNGSLEKLEFLFANSSASSSPYVYNGPYFNGNQLTDFTADYVDPMYYASDSRLEGISRKGCPDGSIYSPSQYFSSSDLSFNCIDIVTGLAVSPIMQYIQNTASCSVIPDSSTFAYSKTFDFSNVPNSTIGASSVLQELYLYAQDVFGNDYRGSSSTTRALLNKKGASTKVFVDKHYQKNIKLVKETNGNTEEVTSIPIEVKSTQIGGTPTFSFPAGENYYVAGIKSVRNALYNMNQGPIALDALSMSSGFGGGSYLTLASSINGGIPPTYGMPPMESKFIKFTQESDYQQTGTHSSLGSNYDYGKVFKLDVKPIDIGSLQYYSFFNINGIQGFPYYNTTNCPSNINGVSVCIQDLIIEDLSYYSNLGYPVKLMNLYGDPAIQSSPVGAVGGMVSDYSSGTEQSAGQKSIVVDLQLVDKCSDLDANAVFLTEGSTAPSMPGMPVQMAPPPGGSCVCKMGYELWTNQSGVASCATACTLSQTRDFTTGVCNQQCQPGYINDATGACVIDPNSTSGNWITSYVSPCPQNSQLAAYDSNTCNYQSFQGQPYFSSCGPGYDYVYNFVSQQGGCVQISQSDFYPSSECMRVFGLPYISKYISSTGSYALVYSVYNPELPTNMGTPNYSALYCSGSQY